MIDTTLKITNPPQPNILKSPSLDQTSLFENNQSLSPSCHVFSMNFESTKRKRYGIHIRNGNSI